MGRWMSEIEGERDKNNRLPALAVEDVRLRGKSLTESMVSSAEVAKEEDMERLWRATTGELQEEGGKV